MTYYLDTKRLAELVRVKRRSQQHCNLRETASITGISASTIGRILNEQTPDMNTFLTICDWLEIPAHRLIEDTKKTAEQSSARSICGSLQADSRLNPEIKNALIVLIQAAYNGALKESQMPI